MVQKLYPLFFQYSLTLSFLASAFVLLPLSHLTGGFLPFGLSGRAGCCGQDLVDHLVNPLGAPRANGCHYIRNRNDAAAYTIVAGESAV